MLRNENPDTLASHNCTKDHFIVVIGVAFSLIMIMLQTKSFVRVHSLVVLNIPIETIQKCEHIIILYQYCRVDLLVEISVGKVNKFAHMKQNSVAYKMCVKLAAHETLLPNEQHLFTKFQNLCFALNCTILY